MKNREATLVIYWLSMDQNFITDLERKLMHQIFSQ